MGVSAVLLRQMRDAATPEDFLAAYDAQLRTDAETPSAVSVANHGSLRLVTFSGGRGFVTYPPLEGNEADEVPRRVAEVLEHYRSNPEISRIEWKTRGHDQIPGLHEALLRHGFQVQETESIMIGWARSLDGSVVLPDEVTLRQVHSERDVQAMADMVDIAFHSSMANEVAEALLRRLSRGDGMELWVAETNGEIVGAGRLEPVAGTDFAGIWGGATLPQWRGRGIYRALTAARARSALAKGRRLIHSDSTEYSRPILERSGLVKVSTTTPYLWRRQTERGESPPF
jgi:GNAT superfamily N-acetyltransferase